MKSWIFLVTVLLGLLPAPGGLTAETLSEDVAPYISSQAQTPNPAGIGDPASELDELDREASTAYRMGLHAAGIAAAKRAIALRRNTLGLDHPDTTRSINNLAVLYAAMGAYGEAEGRYHQVLAIRAKSLGPEHPDTLRSFENLVALHVELRPEDASTAASLEELAALYSGMGVYAKAEPLYQQALVIREKVVGPEHPDTATSLNDLAQLYVKMGAYAKAEPLHQRALAIRERVLGPGHPDTVTSLNNLAWLYQLTGAYAKAKPLQEQAVATAEEALGPEDRETARSLNGLGLLYEKLGLETKAEPLLRRALAVCEKVLGTERPETASVLSGLAQNREAMGEYAEAESLHRRALEIREKTLGPNHPETASSLNALAVLYSVNMGDQARAEPLYERALAIRERVLGPAHPHTASSLANLAELYLATGAYNKAEPLFQRALTIAAGTRSPELLSSVLHGLGDLGARQQRPSEAIFYLKQSVNAIQGLRGQLTTLDPELQRSFLAQRSSVYRFLADGLVDQGRLPEAQRVLAMLKEEEYFEFVRRDAGADVGTTKVGYSASEQPWNARYQKIAGELVRLGAEQRALREKDEEALSPEERIRVREIDGDLEVASQAFTHLLDELRAAFAAVDKARGEELAARQFDTSRMGAVGALGPGTVLLQYIVLKDGLRILLTTADIQKPYKLATGEKVINRLTAQLLDALRHPALDPRPRARALYDLLIAPLNEDLEQAQAKTLMVSLDGTLRYVPLAALYDGEHYLAERYAVAVYLEAAADRIKDKPETAWQVAGFGVTRETTVEAGLPPETVSFNALPAARAELEGIVKDEHHPGGVLEGVIRLDGAFTRDALRAALLPRYPVLHVASHFRFGTTEADSYLLLGDGTTLTLADIRTGRYDFQHVDLLALSACETAVGGGQGREVDGLAVTAEKKGAKGVLATLWPVADQTTAALMQRLYFLRTTEHLNKAEALRQAQLGLLQGKIGVAPEQMVGTEDRGLVRRVNTGQGANDQAPAYVPQPGRSHAHPYYWAPFILMGNWL